MRLTSPSRRRNIRPPSRVIQPPDSCFSGEGSRRPSIACAPLVTDTLFSDPGTSCGLLNPGFIARIGLIDPPQSGPIVPRLPSDLLVPDQARRRTQLQPRGRRRRHRRCPSTGLGLEPEGRTMVVNPRTIGTLVGASRIEHGRLTSVFAFGRGCGDAVAISWSSLW